MAELLASKAELELLLQGDDPEPVELDTDTAELFIRLAGNEVRAYTGQLFDHVEEDTIILNGTGTKTLLLPELPVTNVLQVLERVEGSGWADATVLAGPDDVATGERPTFDWSEDGRLRRIDGDFWRDRFRWYRIVNEHGYDNPPDEVVGVVLRIAARSVGNPEGLRSETIGRYSYTKAGSDAGVGLFDADRDELVAYHHDARARAGTAPAGSGS